MTVNHEQIYWWNGPHGYHHLLIVEQKTIVKFSKMPIDWIQPQISAWNFTARATNFHLTAWKVLKAQNCFVVPEGICKMFDANNSTILLQKVWKMFYIVSGFELTTSSSTVSSYDNKTRDPTLRWLWYELNKLSLGH